MVVDGSDGGQKDIFGQADGEDGVVEGVIRRHLRGDGAGLRADDKMVSVDAEDSEHGGHQRGFVFAVPVAVGEHVRRGMRLEAADAKFNGNVADFFLHKVGNGGHLLETGFLAARDFGDLLADGGRGIAAATQNSGVPVAHLLPVAKPGGSGAGGRDQRTAMKPSRACRGGISGWDSIPGTFFADHS